MKNKILTYIFGAVLMSLVTASNAQAGCNLALAGVRVVPSTLNQIKTTIDRKIRAERGFDISTYTISHVSELVSSDADFLIYIEGYRGQVGVALRDVVANYSIYEKVYRASTTSVDATVDQIAKDFAKLGLPKLPAYCRK